MCILWQCGAEIDKILTHTRISPGGWEHLLWLTVIGSHLVSIFMVFVNKMTEFN